MNSTKKNLYFFFPYRGVGGVPVLFLRLANYLSNLNMYNIFLIDYEDGYMAQNYDKQKNIQLVLYDTQKNIYFKHDDIVVFQSMPLWGMPTCLKFSEKTKLIYWNLHPYNMFGYASSIGKYFKNKLVQKLVTLGFRYQIYLNDRKAIKTFHEKNALFFMDGENYKQTQTWLDVQLNNPIYLPLIIDNIENRKLDYQPKANTINCIWIGRIGDFKVHILIYTLKKLNEIARNSNQKIIFTVVGTGEYLEYLKEEVKFFSNIQIIFIEYIDPGDLKDVLQNMDMGFAMGTAALDFAKYGLPTVLLDFTYKEIKEDYKFDWLYDTQNYILGREISENMCEISNKSLENMIKDLLENYQSISLKSFQYVENNFEIEKNVNQFIDLLEQSSLTFSDLDIKYFEMNIFHKFIGAKKYYP